MGGFLGFEKPTSSVRVDQKVVRSKLREAPHVDFRQGDPLVGRACSSGPSFWT